LRRLRKFRRLGAKAKACAVEGAGSHLSRNCGGEGGAPGKGKNKVNYPTLRQRMAEGWGTRLVTLYGTNTAEPCGGPSLRSG